MSPEAPNQPLLLSNAAIVNWHLPTTLDHGAAEHAHSLGGCAPSRAFRGIEASQAAFAAEFHVRLVGEREH